MSELGPAGAVLGLEEGGEGIPETGQLGRIIPPAELKI